MYCIPHTGRVARTPEQDICRTSHRNSFLLRFETLPSQPSSTSHYCLIYMFKTHHPAPATLAGPEWATLRLEKFSYAESSPAAKSHQWVHDSRSDELLFNIRLERLSDREGEVERTMMRVTAGKDTLVSRSQLAFNFKVLILAKCRSIRILENWQP
jgi:hypothetical protein